ncbi:TetR/AcrR family transcriptional regulator [Lactiplantibacillus pentosus]|uniref:TetR/AcrR family transcriptional regulator n=1 Tax=Lactiplantibacillus pentosus TaxID=1589 RepID=UPI001E503D6E|nr:TetR/AcrR family transcriptional regulator [Lactiplantibacillus pentosus]
MPLEQYQLTDAKLLKHLLDLIETGQTFESITVTELCLKSGVSRKTFYRHYSSTQKVIEDFLDSSANDFIGVLKETPILCLNDFIDALFKFWVGNKNRLQVLQNFDFFSYTLHRLTALKLLDIVNLTESSNWQHLTSTNNPIFLIFVSVGYGVS